MVVILKKRLWCERESSCHSLFCYGDEENGHRACKKEHLTTANQSEIRKAYLVSVAPHLEETAGGRFRKSGIDFD